MKSAPASPQTGRLSRGAKSLIIILSIICVLSCLWNFWITISINGNAMNIGIISYDYQEQQNKKALPTPFNQFDDRNDDAERKVEKLIFGENTNGGTQPYVTLIVATTPMISIY